ncbi:MAG: hypothetical protein KGZ46_01745 [Hydrogenophaga sp.]|nr:hypothetical protein [Hydrogenophaga sp.]
MFRTRFLHHTLLAAGLSLSLLTTPAAHARSEASVAVSALPVASLVGASAAVSAVTTVPLALSAGGAVLVVKTVELSAQGTVWVLERLSDGARASVRLSSRAAGATSVGVGTLVTVSLTGAGVLLSAAGQVLAFIPNAMGEALLANEQVTR